jgi:hypothetical protein
MKRAREDASTPPPSRSSSRETKRTKAYAPTYIQLLITSFDVSAKGLTDRIRVTLREAKEKVNATDASGGDA